MTDSSTNQDLIASGINSDIIKKSSEARPTKIKYSLQWRLVVMLTLVILIFSSIVAGYSAWQGYTQAQRLQDMKLASLVSLAESHDLTFKQDQVNVNFDYDAPNIIDTLNEPSLHPNAIDLSLFNTDDIQNQTIIFWLSDNRLQNYFEPQTLANLALKSDGLYDIHSQQSNWRVYIYTADPHNKDHNRLTTRLLVAEKSDIRKILAWQSAKKILLPLMLLIPLMVLVIVLTINQLFLPLRTITEILQHTSASPQSLAKTYHSKDLSLLINPELVQDLPSEIQPFLRLIQQQVNDLMAMMATNKRFIANASHQLRTPMTAVLLQAENLKYATVDTVDYQQQVDELLASIKRNNQLMNQLLMLAKSEQYQNPTAIKPYSTIAVISQILIDYYPLADQKQLNLGVDSLVDVVLPISEIGFKMIVQNLIENAIKYTPHGGNIDVCLQYCQPNQPNQNQIMFCVTDSGLGIADTEISKVIEPFYQVLDTANSTVNDRANDDTLNYSINSPRHVSSQQTGFGLGLSIVSNLVANSGGQFTLHNRYDPNITTDTIIGLQAVVIWQIDESDKAANLVTPS